MNGHSFTAGADHRACLATMNGFSGGSTGASIDLIVSGGTAGLEAGGQNGATGRASNKGDTILAIVDIDPSRGAAEWSLNGGIGVFTGSFIIRL